MPRGGGGRLSGRKRKALKSATKESTGTGRDADLISVLKAGATSATSLDESCGDLTEFQASNPLSKRRRKELVKPDRVTRKTALQKTRENKWRREENTLSDSKKDKAVSSDREPGKRSSPGRVKETKEAEGEGKGKVKGRTEDKIKTVNSPSRQIKISPVKNIGSQRKQTEGSKSVSPDKRKRGRPPKVPPVRCPCCDRTAKEIFLGDEGDMNDHALICLHEKFSKENATSTSSNTGTLTQTSASENMEPIMCQICNGDLTHSSEEERTRHVNRCIDGPSGGDATEIAGSTPQDSAAAVHEEDGTDGDEAIICQICSKNISHMNSRRRMQHVNRCIDSNLEVDQSPAEDSEQPPPSSTQETIQLSSVPSCIICGIPLNTQQKKRNHLKSCALKNNITTVQLLDMVKRQEMGLPVENVQPSNSVHRNKDSSTAGQVKKVRRPRKKKKEDLDEDVQVAMAITASIAEQEDEERRAKGLPVIDRQVSDKAPSKKIKKRRGRPHKQSSIQFHPLLTRTLSENKKIWQDRLAALIERPSQRECQTPEETASGLAGRFSKKASTTTSQDESSMTEEVVRPIWQLTRCDALLGSTPFYVERLMPFVASEQKAKKTKKNLRFEDETGCTDAREQQVVDINPSRADACQGVITQEAISALAGLIAEDSQDEDETRSRLHSPPASGFIPASAHNNDANPSSITRPQQALLESLRNLVDSPSMDPITIRTKDNQTVHAHHFILALRCPKLLEENNISLSHRKGTSRKEISLHDYDKTEVVALMAYLYAGDTDFPVSCTSQIRRFSKRYNLEELEAIFKRRSDNGSMSRASPSQSEQQEKDIEDLIESIWCDKNDNSSTQRGETSSENSDEPPDNADLTEIYEFALSQKNSSTSKEVENTDDGNPESVGSEQEFSKGMETTHTTEDKESGTHLDCNGREKDKAQEVADGLNERMEESNEQEKEAQESSSVEKNELSDDVLQDVGDEEMEDTTAAGGRNSRTDRESDESTNHETSVNSEMQVDGPASPMIGKEKVVVIPFQNIRKPGRPKNSKIRLHSKVGAKRKRLEKESQSNDKLEDMPTPGRRKSGITAKQGSCQLIEEKPCDGKDSSSVEELDSEQQSQSLNQSDAETEKQTSPRPITPRKRGRPSAENSQSGLSRVQGSDGDVSEGSSTASPRRKRGRPRKLSKENKNTGSSSQMKESASASDNDTLQSGRKPDTQSYLLVERRWSLRSPQEPSEKSQPLSSSPKKTKRANSRGRKSLSVPERFQVLKLATKKRGFKFKKMNSEATNSKKNGESLQKRFQHSGGGDEDESNKGSPVTVTSGDEEYNIEMGEKSTEGRTAREKTNSDPFDQVWENWNNSRNSQHGLPQPKDKETSFNKSASLFEDDDDITEDKVEEAEDEVEEEEVAQEVVQEEEREVELDDINVNYNSANCNDSPSSRITGSQFSSKYSTPSSTGGKMDRISQLKVNLGKKLNIQHLETNCLSLIDIPSGLNLDKDETGTLEASNLSGKENKPEVASSKESNSEAARRNGFDLCDSDDFATSPIPATPLSSPLSNVPSTSSSPVFDKSSSSQTEVGSVDVDLKDRIDKGVSHAMSPLGVIGNDPLGQLSVSSDCLKSLQADGQVLVITEVTTDQLNGHMTYTAAEPQPAEEQMEVVEGQEGSSQREDTFVGTDTFVGMDFAEEFAFDQEVLGFGDDICLGVEEVEVSCAPSENGIVSGDDEKDEDRTKDERNKNKSSSLSNVPRDDDKCDDSIDLTKDDDATLGQKRPKFLGEIDLTDDEGESDANDDQTQADSAKDVSVQVNDTKVTKSGECSRLDVYGKGSSGSNHETNKEKCTPGTTSGDSKDNEADENESPVIPGCSRSFIEDLASAPNDDEFWTEEDLCMDPSGKRNQTDLRTSSTTLVNAKTPSAPQIVSARSVSFEEFLSPAPITPMPQYDEMVTPELMEHLGKYGVKKLKKKKARLKLKEIYQYTHQVLEEDESPKTGKDDTNLSKETPVKHKKSRKSKLSPKKQQKKQSPKKQQKKTKKMSDESTKSRPSSTAGDGKEDAFTEPGKAPKKVAATKTAKSSTKRTHSKDKEKGSQNHIGGDSEPGADICSQSSGSDDRDDFGESIISDEDSDEEIPSSQVTSNPDESIRDFILRTPKFYEKCLLYQPFDLDEFHKDLKVDHIKVSKSCLMNVLDAMCLTFRHKNRVRRSPKKSQKPGRSPKKRVILTPKKSLSLS